MGSGKTVTGRALAKLTGRNFLDLDGEIESRTRLTINEIFQKKGEPFFRAEEKNILTEAARQTDSVIATGGGAVLILENVEKMKATGRVIYLETSLETLWQRVREKKDRPLLQSADPKAMLIRLFQERRPLYESASDGRVLTDGLSAETVARKIVDSYLK